MPHLHHGDYVGSPMPTGGHIPHWSRWEKSATTFGPVGRVVATVILFATILPAVTSGGILYLITFPIVAGVMLNSVWAKGWVVPDEPDLPPPPASDPPPNVEPLTRTEWAARIARWTVGLAVFLVFAYGPNTPKAVILGLSAIVVPWWFFRVYLDR